METLKTANNANVTSKFSNTTGSGKVISTLKQFRVVNLGLCQSAPDFNAYLIDPTIVAITPGFNTREMGMGEEYYLLPEVAEHIHNIKMAYINGDYVEPIKVVIVDGVVTVRQGHCRLHAAREAVSEGHQITFLCNQLKMDEVDAEMQTLNGNKGMALSPVAIGASYLRLINTLGGMTLESLAIRENRQVSSIRQMMRLPGLPVELKKYIHSGVVSYFFVLELVDSLGESKAIEHIRTQLEVLQASADRGIKVPRSSNGALRVRPSTIKSPRVPPTLATQAVESIKMLNEQFFPQLKDVDFTTFDSDKEITISISLKTLNMLQTVRDTISEVAAKQLRKEERKRLKVQDESEPESDDQQEHDQTAA